MGVHMVAALLSSQHPTRTRRQWQDGSHAESQERDARNARRWTGGAHDQGHAAGLQAAYLASAAGALGLHTLATARRHPERLRVGGLPHVGLRGRGEQYGVADRELEIRSAATKRLSQVAPGAGDRLSYTYDFGDDWEHGILVEAVDDAEAGVSYPRCVAGRRACPPEDCGGIWGYSDLLEILADPAHKEHEDRLEWLGLSSAAEFDPDAFDLDQVNSGLSART